MAARAHATEDARSKEAVQLARRVTGVCVVWLILAGLCLATAFFWPLGGASEADLGDKEAVTFYALPKADADIAALLTKLAGVRMIRPAQLRAAIKNTGAAAQLLKQLKLQGVVDMGGKPVAYIVVEKQGVATVGEGDKVLDFLVERIEPGKVTLVLEGVSVELTH